MTDIHANVKGFDFHATVLTPARGEGNTDFSFDSAAQTQNSEAMARMIQIDRFEFERVLWQKNLMRVAGVDEAGRGPLAGPVVAAAAVLPPRWAESGLPRELEGLNDSKQLSEMQRENFFTFLISCGEVEFSIAQIDATQIDEINILQATHRAMNDALTKLSPQPEHVLVDGRPVGTMRIPQTAIVKGDARSYSIAAASVLAKVTRDRLMREFHARFPKYGFAEHKGYGTARHLAAIEKFGACPIHRKSFAPLKTKEAELFNQ
jgi:ribonuclease HII